MLNRSQMASNEEKTAIVELVGEYNPVEWPWNKHKIAIERKNALSLIQTFGNESDDFNTSMLVFMQLIMTELMSVHGSVSHYDSQDGGKISAILLMVDNFIQNQTAETALSIHDLIMNIDIEIYLPGSCGEVELQANIINDILFIMRFLEDWCLVSGHKDWFPSS